MLGTLELLGSRTNRRHRLGTGGVADRLLRAASGHAAPTLLWLPLVRSTSLTPPPRPLPAQVLTLQPAGLGSSLKLGAHLLQP